MFHYKLYGLQHFAALQNQDLTNGVGFLGYHIRNVVNAMVNASIMFGMVPNPPDFRVISCQKNVEYHTKHMANHHVPC